MACDNDVIDCAVGHGQEKSNLGKHQFWICLWKDLEKLCRNDVRSIPRKCTVSEMQTGKILQI